MSGTSEDIPESRWTKKALLENEKRYRRLLENSPDIIFRMSLPDRKYEYVSAAAVQLTGYTPEDYYSHSGLLEKLIPPDWQEYFKKEWKALLRGDMPPFYEYQIVDRAGKTRWFHQRNMLIRDECGHPVSIEGIITDITERKLAEDALHKAEEKLRSITENSPDMILLINTKWEIRSINHTVTLEPGQVIGKSVLDFIPVEFRDEAIACFEQVRTTGKPGNYHTEYHFPTGEVQHFDSNVGPVFHGGEIETLVINARDITARKKAVEALRENEEKYRILVERANDGICVLQDGIVKFCNRRISEYWGGPVEEILGRSFQEFLDPGAIPEIMERYNQRMRGESSPPVYNTIIRRKDGSKSFVEVNAGIISYEGRPGDLLIIRDINDRKMAEEALRESEEKYRDIFEESVTGLFRTTEDGSLIDANDAFARIYNFSSASEMIADSQAGRHLYISRHLYANPEDRKEIHRILTEQGKVENYETRHIKRDGTEVWVSISARAVRDAEGTILFYEGSVLDITRRKQAEEALRESEEKYRDIFENSVTGLFRTAKNGLLVDANDAIARMYGFSDAAELLASGFDVSHSPYANSEDRKEIHHILISQGKVENYETRHTKRDGTEVWVSISARTVRDAEGTILFYEGSVLDITRRKLAEEALRQSELLLREVFNNANDAVFLLERTREGPGTYLLVNDKAVRMLGYSRDELLEMSPRDIVPGDIAKKIMPDVIQKLQKEGHATFESAHRRKDGSIYPIEVSTHTFRYNGKDVDLSIIRDITGRKRVEDALQAANKKLNLLSGITRHDICNQLTALRGYITILEETQPGISHNEYFQKVSATLQRIYAMIQFTREYEPIGVHAPVWHDCRTLVDTATKQAPLEMVIVNNDIPAGSEVFSDPLIAKVFFNLMDNAVRYGGKITTIRFSVEDSGDGHLVVCEDDGDGIPAGEKEKIFERGFGKNTGLGLALSREILSITGITISETGEPGKGARFEITVPNGAWRMDKDSNKTRGCGPRET